VEGDLRITKAGNYFVIMKTLLLKEILGDPAGIEQYWLKLNQSFKLK
jgi:hypothetical protein